MATYGGIDLGGTKIQAVVVDEHTTVLGSARRATPTTGGPGDVAREMAAALRDAAHAAGVQPAELTGVGVGSPGRIEDGNVTGARNLPGWEGTFALAPELAKELGVEVKLGNDVQVATYAEFKLGAGRLYDSLLGVFWGTGVGGGLILARQPWRGRGGAGEIGHMVIEIDGARCTCGRRGCMEAYAGRGSMERHARKLAEKGRKTRLFELMEERGRTRLTSGVWARALEHGDKLAIQIIDRAVAALGAGIASAQNLLDVEGVIIGGGLGVRLGHPYAKRISDAMQPHLFADSPPQVHVAALGDLGGAVGAALLVSRGAPKAGRTSAPRGGRGSAPRGGRPSRRRG
jgi:glucokinase